MEDNLPVSEVYIFSSENTQHNIYLLLLKHIGKKVYERWLKTIEIRIIK